MRRVVLIPTTAYISLNDKTMTKLVPKIKGAWLALSSALAVFWLSLTSAALAFDPTANLKTVAEGAGYSPNDVNVTPAMIVGNVIGYILALLGVVFTILIIYAGFLYMTAQGNEEQVGKAKKLMMNAIIGMVIIGASYAISSFVISTITKSVANAPT